MSVLTNREYIKSTLTYCPVRTAYPFGFSATIGEKVTTEKKMVHVHTAIGWNVDPEMNIKKVQATSGRIHIWSRVSTWMATGEERLWVIELRESSARRMCLTESTKCGKWSVKGRRQGEKMCST